ncbi:MAG: transglutaminase-like cysteine peptidase [Hyphomicrobiaceae bacterium]|nr:transglutaminase-like cysteine peptidase [Hyphomicrobiaceae bacterium]
MKFGGVSIAIVAVAGATALGLPPVANANPLSQRSGAPFMRVYGVAQPPYGHVQFCERAPIECRTGAVEDQRFNASAERLNELDRVNRQVNREIAPATDLEIYGQTEYWTIPTTRGDCEDYALLKRKRLIARGWPASALLMTVVRDEKGEGHAVLTVRTQQGDFVLDNKVNEVKVWFKTGYHYVMRQSYLNPRIWMTLDPIDGTTEMNLAGVGQ